MTKEELTNFIVGEQNTVTLDHDAINEIAEKYKNMKENKT
jgi:hypothetical protein